MIHKDIKRKLTAILSADVVGYSRLMGEDEVSTIRTLKRYKEKITDLVQNYRGRVVDAPGDNLLAEFVSVVDAVQCAVEIQREIAECNEETFQECQMTFRIGVNLGDVVEEDNRIYGDGVNIAARLEGLCEGGGICISGTAFEHVENKLKLEFEDLGEHEVKNIAKPVRVYRVLSYPGAAAHRVLKAKRSTQLNWRISTMAAAAVLIVAIGVAAIWHLFIQSNQPSVEPASADKMVFPLPDKPSLVVLPFISLSGDPEQEYFSDGITENITTDLSKISSFLVISRSSAFAYKGKKVKIKQVAEELSVRYVLEGSVQKSDDKIRINAQLIDAITGHHVWAERYDRDLKDIFSLQNEITQKILMTLRAELTEAEMKRIKSIPTENLNAWEALMRGYEARRGRGQPANDKARLMFEKAIQLDPEYSVAYVFLGGTYLREWWRGWSQDPSILEKAFELARKGLELDSSSIYAYELLSYLYLWKDRNHDQAIEAARKVISLDPNYVNGYGAMAEALKFSGQPEEVIALMEKAMRLNPRSSPYYLFQSGSSYYYLGHYDKALELLEKAVINWPNHLPTREYLAAIYTELGREEKAQAELEEIMRISPNYSLEELVKSPYKDPSYLERFRGHLLKAGLPEKPPLPLPDKPSIAVLPFVNMSDDPKQAYFGDGISEEIITALSKMPKLFVIARNSSFSYKGKSVRVQQIGRELGVKYFLEGSVRKEGNRVRIAAQLIDAATGNHIWAERYDRDLKDIFALQDEITMKIITALRVQLMEGEHARSASKGTTHLEAYLKLLQGRELSWRFNKNDNEFGRQLVEEAIALDPNYANAHVWLAATYLNDVWLGSSKSPKQSYQRAIELAQKALRLDDSLSNAHSLLALLYALTGQYDEAVAEGERGVELGPSDEAAHRRLGVAFSHIGRYEEAISMFEKAIRFNPFPRSATLFQLGAAHLFSGNCNAAVEACEKAVEGKKDDLLAHVFLAAVYGSCNRDMQARATAVEILRMNPQFSIEYFERQLKFKKVDDRALILEGLRLAGLK